MGLSARLFLLSADSTLHAMANAAFMRMLRRKTVSRIPGFAGPRVRLASALHFLRSRHRCRQFAGCGAFHRPAIRPRGRPVRTCGPSAGSRGPLSMQPFASSSKAAPGSPIGPSCAASNWQCWGNCHVRRDGWFVEPPTGSSVHELFESSTPASCRARVPSGHKLAPANGRSA